MGPWCAQMGVFGWLGLVALVALVVAVAAWTLTRLFPVRSQGAELTLDQRLARGEIDPQTYRAVREELARLGAEAQAGRG